MVSVIDYILVNHRWRSRRLWGRELKGYLEVYAKNIQILFTLKMIIGMVLILYCTKSWWYL